MYVWGILVLMLAGETGWGACMKKRAVGMIRSFGVGERRDVHGGCHDLHDHSCVESGEIGEWYWL